MLIIFLLCTHIFHDFEKLLLAQYRKSTLLLGSNSRLSLLLVKVLPNEGILSEVIAPIVNLRLHKPLEQIEFLKLRQVVPLLGCEFDVLFAFELL